MLFEVPNSNGGALQPRAPTEEGKEEGERESLAGFHGSSRTQTLGRSDLSGHLLAPTPRVHYPPSEKSLMSEVRLLGKKSEDGSIVIARVTSVLESAKKHSLRSVHEACEEALTRCVSTDTCVPLRQLAVRESLPNLSILCDRHIRENFHAVLHSAGALQLPRVQVQLDVSSLLELGADLPEKVLTKALSALDSMHASSLPNLEEAVVQLVLLPDLRVLEWTAETRAAMAQSSYSPEKRLQDVLAKVKSGRSPVRQLILCASGEKEEEDENEEAPKVSDMRIVATAKLTDTASVCMVETEYSLFLITVSLCAVLQNGCLPASPTTGLPTFSQTSGCFISQMKIARSGFGVAATDSELLAIGGFGRGGCLDVSERYNSLTNSWKEVGKMGVRRGRFAMATMAGTVYAIGGSDGRKELSSLEMLDTKLCEWNKVNSRMPTPRSCLGAAELNGKLYAVGGYHYAYPLKTVEAFDPATSTWQSLSPLSTPRADLAVVSCTGKIYAIGGKANGVQCLSSVECYNPSQRVWYPVASMTHPRRNATAVVVKDKIMVIGGYNGNTVLRSVEMYNPLEDTWSECPPICTARSHASATLYHEKVYILGGYTGSVFLNTVECFDTDSQQWTSFV